ncbi:YrrS family protein [Bacillus sp. JJ1122]|uniref:YrrS family protein n=1 Tax=Bacillus sp. JJ1122 TaxID=3122951 RepID=UPI002FFFD8A7
MKNDYDNLNEGARSRTRAKRRKTNLILNTLIVVVILLIVFVSANIFFSNDEGAADNSNSTADHEKDTASSGKKDNKDNNGSENADEDNNGEKTKQSDDDSADDSESAESEDSEDLGDPVVTEGGSDANVKQTIENPGWQPVGTTQSGEHAPVFDQNSVDWQEMILAYSYATGIDKNNMTVWWNENNGAPNTAVGTISAKGSDQTYRVAIEWVEGQGWKPVKVEELIQNDKR